jgi:hypothetical protein
LANFEQELCYFLLSATVCSTNTLRNQIFGLQSIIDKCRICRTEGETIEHIISSCTVLAQSEYKKRHDLAVKFNLLKNTQPHYV